MGRDLISQVVMVLGVILSAASTVQAVSSTKDGEDFLAGDFQWVTGRRAGHYLSE